MKLLILILLLAQRLPPVRSTGSGGGGGSSSPCTPTTEHLARRASLTSLPDIPRPTLPMYGGAPLCDPAYGSQVTRVDDGLFAANQVSITGTMAFNRDSSAIASGRDGSLWVNDLSLTQVSSNARAIQLIQTPEAQVTAGINQSWWDMSSHPDAPTSFYTAVGMRIYLVSTIPNTLASTATASLVADLTAEYPGGYIFQTYPASSSTRVAFVIQDSARGFAKLAYYVIDILNRSTSTPTTNYTVARKFKNGVDSPNWHDFQSVGSLQFTSNIAGVTVSPGVTVNGYKPALDKSGQWLTFIVQDFSGCSSPSVCGVLTASAGPYNTIAVMNVASGEIRWMQGTGHPGLGNGIYATWNSSHLGECLTTPKTFIFADLTTDPSYALNRGRCNLVNPVGWGLDYSDVHATSNTAVHMNTCTSACPSTVPPFQDELYTISFDGATIRRQVRLYHQRGLPGSNEYLQPVWNRDGTLIAFQSNWGTTNSYIFVLKPIG